MSGTPSDPLELVGKTIADKYAIESVVGQGGFAIVYRATHLLWKVPVAVKVFSALGAVSKEQRQQLLDDFLQEGRLLTQLSGRTAAILQARDVAMLTTGSGESVPYMVLEWLEGRTLDAILVEERAAGVALRTVEEAARLLEPIAQALAIAHEAGIVHRDLKPANIFVLGDPGAPSGVKLLDFGIAKVVQDAQKMGFTKTSGQVTSFTPYYGAPEQFDRRYGATSPGTDVFALALVLVELASGREPLAGDSIVQLAFQACDGSRRPTPRTLGVPVGQDVEAVFLRALAVDPKERFRTAGDFWRALGAALGGQGWASTDSARGPASRPIDSSPLSFGDRSPTALAQTAIASSAAAPALASAPAAPKKPPFATLAVVVGALALSGGVAVFALAPTKPAAPLAPSAAPRSSGPPQQVASGSAAAPARGSAAAPAMGSAAAPAMGEAAAKLVIPDRGPCPERMVPLSEGMFYMGTDDRDAYKDEKPQHQVVLKPYCIDVFEVTVDDYLACSNPGRCAPPPRENDWPGISAQDRKTYDPLCNVRDPARRKHPINCIDWQLALEFCEKTGKRLPTEAEWEFATRSSDGRKYPWGYDEPTGGHLNACGPECVEWFKSIGEEVQAMYPLDDKFPNTAPVGSFPAGASKFGLQDVVGNVWEWTADWYGPYTKTGGSPKTGTERVARGGAWNGSDPSWVRPTHRFKLPPKQRSHGVGFRCAKSL